ncbi:PHD-finger domain-containing protein [Colletotrichum higginsianum]|nr:PHD-finger domain-containing protein [Colletotrichum higginsianum]
MSSNLPAYSEPEILRRPMPRPPLKRKRAKGDGNGHPMCTNCKRTSYTSANRIISDEVAVDLHRFQCRTCEVEEKEHAKYQRQLALYREAKQEQAEWKKQHNDIERRREKRLATLPKFPKTEIVGFEAGNASPAERREYFGDLMQSDLVNLLIFSNELQPGLLADVLVSISKKHPELPIFGSPNWAQPKVPQQEAQRPRQNNPARPKASKQRSKTGGVRKILKTAPAEAADPAANEADDDDALPESWPKAGHGLYAKLKPEKEDPFLLDDNDEEAFSHFMVDPRGKQIMEPLVGEAALAEGSTVEVPVTQQGGQQAIGESSGTMVAIGKNTTEVQKRNKKPRTSSRSQQAVIDKDVYVISKELGGLEPWF